MHIFLLQKPLVILLICLAIFTVLPGVLHAQSDPKYQLGFIPASIEEVDVGFPLINKWKLSAQVDVQTVTQGAYSNGNPFAYMQRFVLRPWIIYSGLPRMKLYLGYARNKKYEIKEAGNPEILERRLIVMGTYSQEMPKGSIFEQVRFETKFFDDKNGVDQTIPRLRARFGVNHYLNQHRENAFFKSPNISYYAELMLKFASKDYSEQHFDIFRMSAYYSAGLNDNLHLLAGIIGQLQIHASGNAFDIYYGPIVALKWNFIRQKRETFDYISADAD